MLAPICPSEVLAIATGLPQPVHGAAEVAPDQHVGGALPQVRSRRRLEEAVARRVFGGTDEVDQLRARLPVRIGVDGHRHGGRPVRVVAAGAFDVDADPLQAVSVWGVTTGRESLRQHIVGGVGTDVAVVGLAQVLHHRVQRLAEEGHERMVQNLHPPFRR